MSTLPRRAVLLALILVGGACAATPVQPPTRSYVLAFLAAGPDRSSKTPEEREKIQAAHLANIGRLADEGKLVVAGPFGDPSLAPELRGIFVFDTPDVDTARAWTSTDPAVQAGVLAMELASFRSPSPLRRVVELDKAETAALAKSGKKPELGERMRGYAMIVAHEPERAESALGDLRREKKVLFEGELVGSPRGNYLAVLDAESVADASRMIGANSIVLREYRVAIWWAMKSLVGIVEPAG